MFALSFCCVVFFQGVWYQLVFFGPRLIFSQQTIKSEQVCWDFCSKTWSCFSSIMFVLTRFRLVAQQWRSSCCFSAPWWESDPVRNKWPPVIHLRTSFTPAWIQRQTHKQHRWHWGSAARRHVRGGTDENRSLVLFPVWTPQPHLSGSSLHTPTIPQIISTCWTTN